jgi:TonB family protein
MDRIVAQSIFTQTAVPGRSWRSYATSVAVHVGVITLLFVITFPAVERMTELQRHVTLIAPVIPAYKPKVIPRPIIQRPEIVRNITPPKPVIPPPVVKPPEPKREILAKAPEIKETPVPAVQQLPEVKLAPPAPPKPEVKTGVFASNDLAKGPKATVPVKMGGFGDPNGVPPADSQQAKLTMAQLGGFDMPNGDGKSGGGGRAQAGGVRAGAFGSFGDPNGVPGGTGTHGSVRTGGFGDGTAQQAGGHTGQVRPMQPATTPVEILFKPKPAYTQEAKSLKLEGQVSLEVVFSANGAVRVLRVVHGLGHGLDEAAQQAATQVRFRPATRDGAPVDTNATIYITFELT